MATLIISHRRRDKASREAKTSTVVKTLDGREITINPTLRQVDLEHKKLYPDITLEKAKQMIESGEYGRKTK